MKKFTVLLFILIDNQNHNYFSISLKRIINQSKIIFSLQRNCYCDIIIKKLYYRSIWRYRKSKNFYIFEITFFTTLFLPTAYRKHYLPFHRFYQIWMQNTSSLFMLPPGNHLKWSFQKKFVSHNVWNLHQVQGQQILKSIIRPNKSLCERQTSLVKNHILYYAWQKWSCGDTRFDICG